MLAEAFSPQDLPLVDFDSGEIEVVSNVGDWNGGLDAIRKAEPFRFAAPIGWKGRIERRGQPTPIKS